MKLLSLPGKYLVNRWRLLRHLAAVAAAVVAASFRRGTFRRTVRNVLARQVLFTGFEAVRFVALLAFLIGISVVVQAQVWLVRAGQAALLGPVLVMVVIREIGPLLVNFVVIGRSGTAIATELGNMNVSGEVRVLDSLGLDPFIYLVVPRVLGVMISVFCLTILFIVISFTSGYLSGVILGASTGSLRFFTRSVFGAIAPEDIVNLLAKTIIPGLLTGVICCTEGLGVSRASTEVPQAATRAVVRSVTALFLSSVIISVFTYV
jgi:phospholipid/cholesterol/gamma-HCH transport system permease protein